MARTEDASTPRPAARRVLAVGAHPDDIEIGCGGTLAKLRARGDEVHALVATSGEAGSDRVDAETLARTREGEAREAAASLGFDSIQFLRLPDGLTGFSREDKVRVIGIVRRLRPHVLFVHSSRDHFLDHKAVHGLITASVPAAGGPWFHEASGEPWSVETMLGYEVWHPMELYSMAVDITETLPRKLEALRRHRSQTGTIAYDDAVEGLARYRGAMSGVGRHAEVFEVLRVPAIA